MSRTQFNVPLIWALNLTGTLTFLTSGIIMLIYAVTPTKSYSKDLLSFAYRKPLYAIVLFVAGLLIATFAMKPAFGISIPLTGTATVNLPSSLTLGTNVSIFVLAALQWPFWLAITTTGLCITARVYHPKLSSTPKQEPKATANAQLTLSST